MPKDKIKSAIDKAFGSGADAAVYENIVYEATVPRVSPSTSTA